MVAPRKNPWKTLKLYPFGKRGTVGVLTKFEFIGDDPVGNCELCIARATACTERTHRPGRWNCPGISLMSVVMWINNGWGGFILNALCGRVSWIEWPSGQDKVCCSALENYLQMEKLKQPRANFGFCQISHALHGILVLRGWILLALCNVRTLSVETTLEWMNCPRAVSALQTHFWQLPDGIIYIPSSCTGTLKLSAIRNSFPVARGIRVLTVEPEKIIEDNF